MCPPPDSAGRELPVRRQQASHSLRDWLWLNLGFGDLSAAALAATSLTAATESATSLTAAAQPAATIAVAAAAEPFATAPTVYAKAVHVRTGRRGG